MATACAPCRLQLAAIAASDSPAVPAKTSVQMMANIPAILQIKSQDNVLTACGLVVENSIRG